MRNEYHEGLNRDQAVQTSRLSSGKNFVGKRQLTVIMIMMTLVMLDTSKAFKGNL